MRQQDIYACAFQETGNAGAAVITAVPNAPTTQLLPCFFPAGCDSVKFNHETGEPLRSRFSWSSTTTSLPTEDLEDDIEESTTSASGSSSLRLPQTVDSSPLSSSTCISSKNTWSDIHCSYTQGSRTPYSERSASSSRKATSIQARALESPSHGKHGWNIRPKSAWLRPRTQLFVNSMASLHIPTVSRRRSEESMLMPYSTNFGCVIC
ncbi:hypothetical protein SJAG_03339 [Schizosaccharomyces japonicus yFS275]|uniref:Uncharacterized protein n=1 Tax=Schizosaccharomyces japonicus (strain yFS275 / FY16936) TaxID=402676 RepID=B6K3Z2_SCHJY|nr:hypothetical protein SJAG_03339 [Schizosaccharomyces japonicus yFS275]EEB08199.1 hypothetical protein SJAG_03339 [Schizosaccharomyces japonicus yFS275]